MKFITATCRAAVNYISMFLLQLLGRYHCWWTICHRRYNPPSSQCFGTDIFSKHLFL